MDDAIFNPDMERSLVGSALIDISVLDRVSTHHREFHLIECKIVWRALRAMHDAGIEPDIVTLSDTIQRQGKLDDIGGMPALIGLINETPSSVNAESYARTVRDYHRRRNAIRVASDLAKSAYDFDGSIGEAMIKASDRMMLESGDDRYTIQAGEDINDLTNEIESRKDSGETWGIKTGYIDLDNLLGGIHPSEMTLLTGEPGAGKSRLLLNIGLNISKNEIPGVLYSLEMGKRQIDYRAISMLSEIPTRKLKTGQIDDDQWERYYKSIELYSRLPFWINDNPDLTIGDIRADLAQMKYKYGIKWFMVDYLFLIGGYDNLEDDTRSARLSRSLKLICRKFDLAGVVINSVTKEGMDNPNASMKHSRGSGQTIHDADVIGEMKNVDGMVYLKRLAFTKVRDADVGKRSIEIIGKPGLPNFYSAEKVEINQYAP